MEYYALLRDRQTGKTTELIKWLKGETGKDIILGDHINWILIVPTFSAKRHLQNHDKNFGLSVYDISNIFVADSKESLDRIIEQSKGIKFDKIGIDNWQCFPSELQDCLCDFVRHFQLHAKVVMVYDRDEKPIFVDNLRKV